MQGPTSGIIAAESESIMSTATTFKIDVKTINLTATENENTLNAITTAIQPADVSKEDFTSAAWNAIKKAVKALHIKNYANKTPDEAVVNAVYHVTYSNETKKIIIPLAELLQGDAKLEYNHKANELQTATVKFINGNYATSQQRSSARSKTEKSYSTVLQWAFDFLISDRKDGVKVYVNSRDVDIISGMLLKLRSEKISTTGERTIQAYIEYAFRQKVFGKPFLVELYSLDKNQNGMKISNAGGESKSGEEAEAEEQSAE